MKHSEMREATRQAIREAFWALYRERPIEKISVRELCQRAGCNRSTFYEYFSDTYSVLEDIEEELLAHMRTRLTQELPASIARNFPEIRLDAEALRPLAELYSEAGDYLSVLLGPGGDPAFQYRYKRTAKDILLNMLDDPAKKFDLSARIISEFTASAIIGAFNAWYPHRAEYPAEKYAALLVSLLSQGSLPAVRAL